MPALLDLTPAPLHELKPYKSLANEELSARIEAVRREFGPRLMILGHHYQQDEVIEHSDLRGDSYQLSQMAAGSRDCRVIVFCGVHFMAETADILANRPEKLALLGTLSLCCIALGVAGFVFYLAMGKEERANWQPPAILQPPPTVFAPPVNDWFADRLLSPVYVTALDAVVMNPRLIEALGDSIAPTTSGEEGASLYRRVGTGDLDPSGETIEFDIKGSKGAAVVSVLATGPDNVAGPPGGYVEYHVAKIKVTLSDGSEIEVPAPSDQPAVKPIR